MQLVPKLDKDERVYLLLGRAALMLDELMSQVHTQGEMLALIGAIEGNLSRRRQAVELSRSGPPAA